MTLAGQPHDPEARLREGAQRLGVTLDDERIERLIRLLDLLSIWNRVYNLTAIRDPAEMLTHHLLDSLAVEPRLLGPSVLDLGTGAGLPGLPLAIARPELAFVLLDSNGKKIRFVRQAILELGIGNAEPVHSRMESYRPTGKFSTILARALASVAGIRAVATPLLASPGRLLIMKGRMPTDELADPTLHGLPIRAHRLSVPFLEAERHLIEIRSE